MSKDIPTPYVWTFQPQLGGCGASQDYSTRMNWLSAGPSMINQVNSVRADRNRILLRQAAVSETPRLVRNPPTWPAQYLFQPIGAPQTFELPRNESLEVAMSNSGMQLAGGGRRTKDIKPEDIVGRGLELNSDIPSASFLRPDGVFQLAGGSRSSFNPGLSTLLTVQPASSLPRSGGIGEVQFVHEFVPSVYFQPFSGPPGTYPDEFIYNYDIVSDSVDGYD
uniref:Pre-hexon-linking protein VIII n=1 Tax=Bovine adenovirus 1 TaxID=10546 RepID=O71198_9ADEN|nr:hexon-associated structural protein pVIII precursor [Bovine adenovirus 1]